MSLLPPLAAPARLGVGSRVPDLGWRDTQGRHVALDLPAHAGRATLLLACSGGAGAAVSRELTKLRDLHDKLGAFDLQVFAVIPAPPRDNAEATAKLKLPFPVLSDMAFALGRALGLDPAARKKSGACAVAITDANQRIEKLIAPAGDGRQAIRALAYCEKRSAAPQVSRAAGLDAATGEAAVVTGQAPVLILPNVVGRDHCARLIRAWETGQRYAGGVASAEHGGNVPIEQIKVREDVALADNGPEARELFEVFRQRLFPDIRKAFQYRVTHAETLRIGCYTAEAGGHFVPHRDDTTPYSAHRRFATSLNLNAGDYEGGYLRFPEYGAQLYSAPTGGAIVFSCSLLHEATRVTRGRRFVLLGFFYSEAEQAIREKLHAKDTAAARNPS